MVGEHKARRLRRDRGPEALSRASDARGAAREPRCAAHGLHALSVATQSALDLTMHLGANAGLPQAETYQEVFRRLGEAGFMDPVLAERLAAWAGFRNVLAHLYASIDYDRAYDALAEVSDLERFAALVSAGLDS